MKLKWFLIFGGILVVIAVIILGFVFYTSPVSPYWNSEQDYTSRYNIEHLDVSYTGQGKGIDINNKSSSLTVTLWQNNPEIWKLKAFYDTTPCPSLWWP